MNEQKTRKNKIGARCLSDLEAELILPTYKRIYQQVDQFRMEKESSNRSKNHKTGDQKEDQKSTNQDKDQKTNNIGIIGARGTGKTSILKTIQSRLENNKHDKKLNDIILPIIVPENMSESSTLMATILGMLSEIVKERDKEAEKEQKRRNGDCIRKSPLKEKCDEVIKQYTYIQKEYRNILIQQYTTENAYVNTSAKVFNSDTEFINRFNELIDELINKDKQNTNLLFLFIDDIDLSTYRCADVVKTLLSYLSNENIVTFISGDLDTFEEALTLDFLRQEGVLHRDILDKKAGSNPLLASKKLLAYEYLKKILPPAYRYNIKYWSLEEKGNYCIADSTENQEGKEQKAETTLSDLLSQALDGWVNPAFFQYAEILENKEHGNQEENENSNEKPQIKKTVLPYTYHLFDNTSRGLNNIYNVLSEIVAARNMSETDGLKGKKLLLDTIVSSKPGFNKYRNEIQQNFFHVGTEQAESKVFFDNVKSIIYQKDIVEDQTGALQDQKKQWNYRITDPIERFSLFILADFSARLLYEKDYEKQIAGDEFYTALKKEAMQDLFFHPVIAEKVLEVSSYSWESPKEKKDRDNALAKGNKEYPPLKEMKLKDINSSFLLKGDLVLNLAYYKNLPLADMLKFYEDKASENPYPELFSPTELKQSTVIAVWNAFSSIAATNATEDADKYTTEDAMNDTSNVIAGYYSVFWKEFAYIRNQTSNSVTQNISIRLFEANIKEANTIATEQEKVQESEQSKVQMRRILSNMLARVLKTQDKDEIQATLEDISHDVLYTVDQKAEKEITEDKERKDIEKREQILRTIDSNNLWQAEAAGDVIGYLKGVLKNYLIFIQNELKGNGWRLNTSDAENGWDAFKQMYTGKTNTIARRTRKNVTEILKNNNADFQQGMSLDTYRNVMGYLENLAGNSRVWYGQSEAQRIVNELQMASPEPKDNESWEEWMERHSYFKFLLQCLYKYKLATEQNNNIVQEARLLTSITAKLSVAHIDADRQTLENFIAELNAHLKDEEKIDSESFEKLFSLTNS